MQQKSVKVRTSEVFCFSHFSAPLFCCGNPIFFFGVPKRRGNGHKRGGSKSAKPEAGRALMECLRAGEGKAVIRI